MTHLNRNPYNMEQIVVKTEVQSNGEILLYYLDDNVGQGGVLTTVGNTENDSMVESSFILSSFGELEDNAPEATVEELPPTVHEWSDSDIKRLLLFYNDNKISFVSGNSQKRHLWSVACKTMLLGKNEDLCQEKLEELRNKYCEIRGFIKTGVYVKWQFLDMCHQAFHDDPIVASTLNNDVTQLTAPEPKIAILKQEYIKEKDGILSIKQINPKSPDVNIENMLNLYIKHKGNSQIVHGKTREFWAKIAQAMGEEDVDYVHKRFLNLKQHYINMLLMKKESSSAVITWPYMHLFNKIYENDVHFHKKHFNTDIAPKCEQEEPEWNNVQLIVLAKYCYDCHDEFQDVTIPSKFLWIEVGRLIEKTPEECEAKYNSLLKEHLDKFIAGDYSLGYRDPITKIFDCTLVKTVKSECSKSSYSQPYWKAEDTDSLVQFFYDKIELFKDKQIHFVCWAAIAQKLNKSVLSCKNKWDELVSLYKSILAEKKENADMAIHWNYIELFDRIYDYGMDTGFLEGYGTTEANSQNLKTSDKVAVKKISFNTNKREITEPREEFKKPYTKQPPTDPRSTKILEYYLKNKEKFQTRSKIATWDPLARKIGLNSSQCAHRLQALKQIYIDHVRNELEKSVITSWPYYTLCKKVFGYRVIKNKLKQGILNNGDWLDGEIKLLISHFSQNFHDVTNNIDDIETWTAIANNLGKSEVCCKEKFLELRKCYRKLKTMRTRNPDVKISWSYFDMFDKIYSFTEPMDVEVLDQDLLMERILDRGEHVPEDDYQCIIVLQEGQELPPNFEGAQIIVQPRSDGNNGEIGNSAQIDGAETLNSNESESPKTSKWTKRSKKRLLVHYINYIRLQRGQEIKAKDMWTEIASKLRNKRPSKCRRLLHKMRDNYIIADHTDKSNNPYAHLLDIVVKLKPNFAKPDGNKSKERVYKNPPMDADKVAIALAYYLEHIEDFLNPRFEKKYLWNQLANHVAEPVSKVYNKIHYLKQAFNIETEEIDSQMTEYSALLKEIIAREVAATVLEENPSTEFNNGETNWVNEEIEQLMLWYLSNLDKFKNPKFNKSYLWVEASAILGKSSLACSKKMSEIRTLYRNMVKENSEQLQNWGFLDLCQKIYGTGRRNVDN